MVASPHMYVEPNVVINTTEVQCHFQMVTLIPEVTWSDIETYCNPGGEAVSRVSWRGVMRVRMSYGTDSAWEFFSALDPAVPQDMVIYPADPGTATGTADNPSATFEAYIGVLPFIPDHEVGASATFDLEFRVVGEPVFDATT
jgi:hypothetical protein